jgi:hypothetical protein
MKDRAPSFHDKSEKFAFGTYGRQRLRRLSRPFSQKSVIFGVPNGGELLKYGYLLSAVRTADSALYVRLEDETRHLKSGKQCQH